MHVGVGQPRGRAEDLLAELGADQNHVFSVLSRRFYVSKHALKHALKHVLHEFSDRFERLDAFSIRSRGHRCIEPHLPGPLLVFDGCRRGGRWRGGAIIEIE